MLKLVRLPAIDGFIARRYSSRSRQGARQPNQAAICPPRWTGCGLARERVYAAWQLPGWLIAPLLSSRESCALTRSVSWSTQTDSVLRLDHVEGAW